VLDASEPLTAADENYLAEFAAKKRILVRNKSDLPTKLILPPGCGSQTRAPERDSASRSSSDVTVVDVCCVSGQGMEALKDAIKEAIKETK